MAFKLSFDFCCLGTSNGFPGLGGDREESEELSLSGTSVPDSVCCLEDWDRLFCFEGATEHLGWVAETSLKKK